MIFATAAKPISLGAALPAAPAAVRLILTTFQTCSRLLQLAGREDSPTPVQLLVADAGCLASCAATLGIGYISVLNLSNIVGELSTQDTLQFLPGARELLLCPELVPCLAITVLVAVLGFDTGVHGSAGSGAAASGAGASSSTPGGTSEAGSSGVQASTRQGISQQQVPASAAESAAGCSAELQAEVLPHYGSSTSTGTPGADGTSSSGRLDNGVNLNSLTPLSCGLFGLLEVDHSLLLTTVRGAKTTTHATWGVNNSIAAFNTVVAHQVSSNTGRLLEHIHQPGHAPAATEYWRR